MYNATFSRIINYFIAHNIPPQLAIYIAGQAAFETNDFSSPAFTTDNNCFGYKYNIQSVHQSKEKGITSSEGDNYAKYDSIDRSCEELYFYIRRRVQEFEFPKDYTKVSSTLIYAELLKAHSYFGGSIQVYSNGINDKIKLFLNL